MSQGNYTRLSLEERIIIENRHKNGENYKSIAISINRSARLYLEKHLRRRGKPYRYHKAKYFNTTLGFTLPILIILGKEAEMRILMV